MNQSSNPMQSEVNRIVDDYLASLTAGECPDIDVLCDQHASLQPHLREQLEAAHKARVARHKAEHAPISDLSDNWLLEAEGDVYPSTGRVVNEYELDEPLGAGGFGMVYAATHARSGERVAIKMLRPEYARDPEVVARLQAEADIASSIRDEHIVEVFKAAQYRGQPYIVMRLVDGIDLQRFSRSTPLPPTAAAEIMRHVARACQVAHANDIVHRDIKPSNILIENETRKPLITDFGLARRHVATEVLTASHQQLGTLHYMPPEQADRRLGPIGPAADIHAIGATLYFLLTGRPPFPREPGASPEATLHELIWEEPLAISPEVPKDLRTICRKCLEKMPVDRYASAADLADDLDKFVVGQPISNRLPGPRRRIHRLFQRRPALAITLCTLFLSIIAGSVVSLSYALEARENRGLVKEAEDDALRASKEAEAAQTGQLRQAYAADMRDARIALASGEIVRAARFLAKYEQPSAVDPRGFEWHYLHRMCTAPSPIEFISTNVEWNRISFDATGERLAAIDREGTLVVWDLATTQEVYRITGETHSASFGADGEFLVLLNASDAAGRIDVHKASDGEHLHTFRAGRITTSIAVPPSRSQLLTGHASGELMLWDIPSGEQRLNITAKLKRGISGPSLDIQHGPVFDVAFSPDGEYFATGLADGTVQVWNLAQRSIVSRGPQERQHVGPVTGVTFSPDGRRVASQSFGEYVHAAQNFLIGELLVWDRDNGELHCSIIPHLSQIHTRAAPVIITDDDNIIPFGQLRPAFSSDGLRVFSTGPRFVQAWNASTGDPDGAYTGHDGPVLGVAVSPDGKSVAALGANRSVRVWPVNGDPASRTIASHRWGLRNLDLSPDGTKIAVVCEAAAGELIGPELPRPHPRTASRCVRVWDTSQGKSLYRSGNLDTHFEQPIFDSVGEAVFCGTSKINLDSQVISPTLDSALLKDFNAAEIRRSRDGSWAVVVSITPPALYLVRTGGDQLVTPLEGHSGAVSTVAISYDDRWIATGGLDSTICIWSSHNGSLVQCLSGHESELTALAFSPDGLRLATADMGRRIRVWELSSETPSLLLQGHDREISGLAFSPNGRRLASSAGLLRINSQKSGEVLLWDTETGMLLLELGAGESHVYGGVVFSPDGRRIYATASPLKELAPARIVAWVAELPNTE